MRETLPAGEIEFILDEVYDLPHKMQRFLDGDHPIEEIAQRLYDRPFFLYLGRHIGLPVALEGALKLKEISYIPTEAYSAGEMKHGPIALLEEGTPVVVVATRIHVYDKIVSNIQETRARGAHVIAIATDGNEDIQHHADDVIYVPEVAGVPAGGAGDPAAAAARLPDRASARARTSTSRATSRRRSRSSSDRFARRLDEGACCRRAVAVAVLGHPDDAGRHRFAELDDRDSRIRRVDSQVRHHGDAHPAATRLCPSPPATASTRARVERGRHRPNL